jgi:hypothetical protein
MAEADKKIISDAQRREIAKTLPDAFAALAPADQADFWNKLEQIKRAETPPKKLAAQCEEKARQLYDAPPLPAGHVAVIEQSKQLGDDWRKLAVTYRQIDKAGGSRFLRQCQLLWLWETVGGELGITTPRKRKYERLKEGEKERRSPHAPVIEYFQATAEDFFGETPGPEQIKKVVARYRRDFSPAIRAEFNAGLLRTVFGIPFDDERKPVVTVDNSKIFILRDGKLMTAAEADADAARRQRERR